MESLGTHDLEAGMRPSRASAFIPVMAITVALLFVFNSAGLVRWTQNLPPGQLGTALSDAANVWHDAMTWAGPARLFEVLKETIGVELR
ncbi:hypothetical protein FHP25_30840 [Vineibacter terrae]|uniref:Uncharacterized protein n=1 Tax=Vineibacter terrae TaxID=2586908 RepID=A0A5C8PCD5_9HYPH|nr:hypothetical protein [Vineibacter terrae]TXL71227.1 hypothetical protein FHP25_30840 [Vineibacter terrae]